jgi:hypothetical protein
MSSQRIRARRLLRERQRAAEQAPPLAEVVRGTLRERYVRCGKAGCHCRKGRGHGPVRYLSVSLGAGESRQITVSAEDFELAQRYVDNYERLWKLLEQISTINRELLQQRLLSPEAKGGGGKRRSRRRGDQGR